MLIINGATNETVIKSGKFKFLRFPNQGIRRNEKIRKLATNKKLSYSTLNDLLIERDRLGIL